MPLTDLSDVLTKMTGGGVSPPQNIFWWKNQFGSTGGTPSNPTAGTYNSYFGLPGNPTHGTGSIASSICDNTTTGSFYIVPPVSGNNYLLGGTVMSNNVGTTIFYDRLCQMSGLSGTSTAVQTVSASINRYTGSACIGNRMYVDIITAVGLTQTTYTVIYINQDGNTATSPPALIGGTGWRENASIIAVPFAAGDTGVRAINSIQLAATTTTIGNFGMFIGRPLLTIGMGLPAVTTIKDTFFGTEPLPIIHPQACVAVMAVANSNTIPFFYGSLHIVEAS